MIKEIEIKNFKSIKRLKLSCKRINIFIGDPNAGKSNLLEALSLLNYNFRNLSDFIRFHEVTHLFNDYDTSQNIEIRADNHISRVRVDADSDMLHVENFKELNSPFLIKYFSDGKLQSSSHNDSINLLPRVLFYRYKQNVVFEKSQNFYLTPPFGENLPSIVLSNKGLRTLVQNILDDLGFKLLIKPSGNDFEIVRESDGISLSFPLISFSDTIKRIIFYLAAIKSNSGNTILFEEPEAHTFPFYTKGLAETIALDASNQFFIITHNPVLLMSMIQKVKLSDLSVNLVKMKDYQTMVTELSEDAVERILELDSDLFLNFEKLLSE
ncbi:MAG: AAA family ATPase [Cyclobacteriaceae bacterium]|nr:AAA family ATPase [Cyclobacteriaceae bacterium]